MEVIPFQRRFRSIHNGNQRKNCIKKRNIPDTISKELDSIGSFLYGKEKHW